MSDCLFSIVIPIYKSEKYLDECVRSVLKQTFRDFELVLVDDGSPDKCPEICDYFAQVDERVKVIHKENGGSVSARKAGVENSTGEYVVFLDSDDWFEERLLNDLKTNIVDYHPTTVVYGYKLYLNNKLYTCFQNTKEGLYHGNEKKKVYDSMISKRPFFTFGIYPTLWTTCTKRELLIDVQKDVPNEITLGDDASVVYACLLRSDSIYVSTITGCVYRDNEQSMTHAFDMKMDQRITILANYLSSSLYKYGLKEFSQLDDYLTFMTIQVAGNYLSNWKIDFNKQEAKRILNSFLNQEIIKGALMRFDTSSVSCSTIAKTKIFLLRRKWLGLYAFLARLFSALSHWRR